MIINFDKLDSTIIQNFYGGTKEVISKMFIDDNNKIMLATLPSKASIGLHKHETSSEILYILKGEGKILENDRETKILKSGMCHYCPKGESHSLINDSNEDLIFFAVVPNQ